MKRLLLTAAALCAFLCALAQEEKPRTGWSFISLPNLSYNSDLGLSLGAWGDLFYYGDGSQGPNFLHHLGFSGAYMTKGSWFLHAFFDSDSLIPGISLRSSATYRDVPADSFYGFNGIASPFDQTRELNAATRTAYYTYQHRYVRVSLLGSGTLSGRWCWLGGALFRWVQTSDFSLSRYDSGRSLYLDYVDRGLIQADEMGGGASLEFKAGVRYDSRDMPLTPGQGLFAQLYLLGNVCLQGGPYHYGQLVADFRQYLPLLPQRLLFAWHLGLQHTLWGEVPFYLANELATPEYRYEDFTGLGSRHSIRGYRLNRITAAGYAWGNFELRLRAFDFPLFKQRFELVLNPFFDLAAITRTYRLEEQQALGAGFYQDIRLPLMPSAGAGFKVLMNHNMIISVDIARAFHPQLSDWMIGMASSYIF